MPNEFQHEISFLMTESKSIRKTSLITAIYGVCLFVAGVALIVDSLHFHFLFTFIGPDSLFFPFNYGVMFISLGTITLIWLCLSLKYNFPKQSTVFLIVIINVFTIIFAINSYMCDDAFITFRTVDNFIHGYGLRWNVVERVQAFTNPLWMFVVSLFYFLFNNITNLIDTAKMYLVVMTLSYSLSLLSLILFSLHLIRLQRYKNLIIFFLVLTSSKAFIDFTSSGLENPLTYLLITLFFLRYCDSISYNSFKSYVLYFLIASLSYTNRPDTILLYVFPLLYLTYIGFRVHRWKMLIVFIVGLFPIYGWTVFSVIYYGFPFPNTYYAKMELGYPVTTILQGINYLFNIFKTDTITPLAILLSVVVSFFCGAKIMLSGVSLVLYILYAINTGGDFMGGRILAAPFLVSVLVLSALLLNRRHSGVINNLFFLKAVRVKWQYLFIVLLLYNVLSPLSTFKASFYQDSILHNSSNPVWDFGEPLFGLEKNRNQNISSNKAYHYRSSNILFVQEERIPFSQWQMVSRYA